MSGNTKQSVFIIKLKQFWLRNVTKNPIFIFLGCLGGKIHQHSNISKLGHLNKTMKPNVEHLNLNS